jgi:aspartyl aminopeptidase
MELNIRQNSMDWSWNASRVIGHHVDSPFLDLKSHPVPGLHAHLDIVETVNLEQIDRIALDF